MNLSFICFSSSHSHRVLLARLSDDNVKSCIDLMSFFFNSSFPVFLETSSSSLLTNNNNVNLNLDHLSYWCNVKQTNKQLLLLLKEFTLFWEKMIRTAFMSLTHSSRNWKNLCLREKKGRWNGEKERGGSNSRRMSKKEEIDGRNLTWQPFPCILFSNFEVVSWMELLC